MTEQQAALKSRIDGRGWVARSSKYPSISCVYEFDATHTIAFYASGLTVLRVVTEGGVKWFNLTEVE